MRNFGREPRSRYIEHITPSSRRDALKPCENVPLGVAAHQAA
jgi:hypothetical protein